MTFVRFADDAQPLQVSINEWKTKAVGIAIGDYSPEVVTVRTYGENGVINPGTTPEDIWDGGGLWVAPTASRLHDIVSSDAADTAQIVVSGITAWDGVYVSETITLTGTTPVTTTNSYVAINTMVCVPGQINSGDVTATAQVDGTVSSYLDANEGCTHQAIYAVPEGYRLIIVYSEFGMNRPGSGGEGEVALLVCEAPDIDPDVFVTISHRTAVAQGTSAIVIDSGDVPLVFNGPAILKMQVTYVANTGTACFGLFDGYLENKNV